MPPALSRIIKQPAHVGGFVPGQMRQYRLADRYTQIVRDIGGIVGHQLAENGGKPLRGQACDQPPAHFVVEFVEHLGGFSWVQQVQDGFLFSIG